MSRLRGRPVGAARRRRRRPSGASSVVTVHRIGRIRSRRVGTVQTDDVLTSTHHEWVVEGSPVGLARAPHTDTACRAAVAGREHDFAGIVLIGIGVVLGLAMYFDLAGPLGSGIETFVGWFFGLGRFLLPLVLVAVGVAFVRKGESSSPLRLVLGWGLVGAVRAGVACTSSATPESFTAFSDRWVDTLGEARRLVRCAVGEPIASTDRHRRARSSVLVAVFVGGAAADHADVAAHDGDHTGRGVGAVAKPVGRRPSGRCPTCRR